MEVNIFNQDKFNLGSNPDTHTWLLYHLKNIGIGSKHNNLGAFKAFNMLVAYQDQILLSKFQLKSMLRSFLSVLFGESTIISQN